MHQTRNTSEYGERCWWPHHKSAWLHARIGAQARAESNGIAGCCVG